MLEQHETEHFALLKQHQTGSVAHEVYSETWVATEGEEDGGADPSNQPGQSDSEIALDHQRTEPQNQEESLHDPPQTTTHEAVHVQVEGEDYAQLLSVSVQEDVQTLPECLVDFLGEEFWLFPQTSQPFDSLVSPSTGFLSLKSPSRTPAFQPATSSTAPVTIDPTTLPPPSLPITSNHHRQTIFPLPLSEQEELFESELTYLLAELKLVFDLDNQQQQQYQQQEQLQQQQHQSSVGEESGNGIEITRDTENGTGANISSTAGTGTTEVSGYESKDIEEMELILDFPDLGLSFSELSTELKQYNLNRLNTFHQALLMEQGFTLTETQQTFPPLRLSLRQQPSKNANRLAVLNKVLERVDPTNQWLPQNQIEVSEESSDADVVGVDEQNGDENGEGLQQQYEDMGDDVVVVPVQLGEGVVAVDEDGYINNGVDEAGENVEYVDETTYYEEQQQEYPSGDTSMQEYQSQEFPADSSVQEQFENGEYAQLDVNPSGGQEIDVEYVDPTTGEVYENGEGYEYTQPEEEEDIRGEKRKSLSGDELTEAGEEKRTRLE